MKIEEFNGSIERKLVLSAITSSHFLSQISDKYLPGCFDNKWADLITSWCVKYYQGHRKAPNKVIASIFEVHLESGDIPDKTTARLVEEFLSSLSTEYQHYKEEINPDYMLDVAGQHFEKVALRKYAQGILDRLDAGKVQEAREMLGSFKKVELGEGAEVDVFHDMKKIYSVCDEEEVEPLVTYPGALGSFFGPHLERDAFIGFVGQQKSSKSYWLLDMAFRAMVQRRRVAYFQVGDMSERQTLTRLMVRACQKPSPRASREWPLTVAYPRSLSLYQEDPHPFSLPRVERKIKVFDSPLDRYEAWRVCQKIQATRVRSLNSYFKFSYHSTKSINITGVKSIVEKYMSKDWHPDVIIIDYADNLGPLHSSSRQEDERKDIDLTWATLRQMSERFHCLVVTATQANREATGLVWLGRKNISEDIRKLSHVTGMVGINVTSLEKEEGVCRLNWIALREGEYNMNNGPSVAGCLVLANPAVCSAWGSS